MKSRADLMGKNIVVFDIEIKKEIKDCSRGWSSFDEMGISVACAFDYSDYRFRIFMDDNIQELVDRLNRPDTLVVAFNNIQFDNKLLRVNGLNLRPDDQIRNYDMLQVSRQACNASQFEKGFKLQNHLEAMQLPFKTADGAMAPVWWKEGKVGKVIDYCLNDVRVEKSLFDHIYLHGTMSNAFKKDYQVRQPEI